MRLFPEKFFLILSVPVMLASCKKYEEEIVPGNVPPPDQTISDITIENYINKTYIGVLGREPDSAEFSNAFNILRQNNVSQASRSQFLDLVLLQPEFDVHLYDLARTDLLNNQDTSEISFYIFLFGTLLQDSAYYIFWDVLQNEIDRLMEMQNIPADLAGNTINTVGLHRRCVNNYFYDQLNMGSLNFVVSVFQNLLFRYPSVNELDEGIKMVDGQSAVLFLQTGATKNDFLEIFFNSNDYFEGQVRDLYLRYLFREPTSSEMSVEGMQYKQDQDYIALQKRILSKDEYIGIN